MIIDEQAAFRSLLMHHVTTRWPDAIISAYDPTAAGHLPDEFSGAGNDVILLGDRHGDDREGVDVLRRFVKKPGFPPVVYFGSDDDSSRVEKLGPDAYFRRDSIDHESFVQGLDSALRARHRPSLTGSLSVGDLRGDAHPAIKGYRVLRKLSATEHSGVYLGERQIERAAARLEVAASNVRRCCEPECFRSVPIESTRPSRTCSTGILSRIYDLGVSDDHAYIAMEYLDNGDLRYRINSGIDETRALDYLRQIASALSAIHSRGVLHRDLKPANIMLRKDGSLALIDFGLAKRARLASAVTDEGEIFGTPYYMSPEQGHGNRVDERSDIYSLGVIFYEMLTGLKPFHASTAMGVIYRHAQAPIPQLPQRYADYQALLERLLAKVPRDRVQTAAEVQQWLQ